MRMRAGEATAPAAGEGAPAARGAGAATVRSVVVNVAPRSLPGLDADNRPPCMSTKDLEIASPSPR